MLEILISRDKEERKIALLENGKLLEYYVDEENSIRKEGNIYIGIVKDIVKGMQSAFVDIGTEKNSFIHLKDILDKIDESKENINPKIDISDIIKTGQKLLVQVKKDSNLQKGARVSTHISMPGRFVVIMPNTEFITVSQKIEDQEEKERLKNIVKENLPKGYGAIIRTSAYGKEEDLIKKDINKIVEELTCINKEFSDVKLKKDKFKTKLLHKNDGIINKLLIDIIDQGIEKVWTNNSEVYKEVEKLVKDTGNSEKVKVELKTEDLLTMYDLDDQMEKAINRKVWLKCGGFITIDKTEALTAIDVNSGKYIGGKDLEQTVFTVNKEASIEIAKQIRLRDIGGIIIIDYIDMEKQESKDKITEILKDSLKKDRSKTQVIGFTPLNLLEMTRKHMCSND